METVVKLAMVLVSLSFVLKLTGYKLRQLLLMALLCALFVGFSWQFAAEQSKTAIASWLSDRELMQDIAVLMTLDVALQMAYCLMAVNLMNSGPLKRRTILVYKLLRLFPGIMVFLVLFSLLVSCVFAFPGVSFSLISWCMAAAVLVLLPLAVLGVRKLLPEKEIRLELLFLSNALTAALGVIATVNGTTASESVDSVDYPATVAVIGIVLLGAALGFLLYRIKSRKS
ncbi:MAG TPA: hypothetical protein IAC35_00915 [Candidatus Cryptobacteroides merdipullorum]|uniref:Uncharacterized protein n=1 Tax=Candidatus Cryptobacteroides merdipullorum TaxID=2840771 RepID=A0A9D1GMT5_9BACT|nr:hypothetical protein [Candidatus Cryptobacteroides merdipullorum]